MKKTLALVLALVMVLGLVACTSGKTETAAPAADAPKTEAKAEEQWAVQATSRPTNTSGPHEATCGQLYPAHLTDKPSTLGNLGPASTIPVSHQGSREGLR